MAATRPPKRTLAHHEGPCQEVVWGADTRFTKCALCGKERYYPAGFTLRDQQLPKRQP